MRAAFEKWISESPYEFSLRRMPDTAAFPGTYDQYRVQLAWDAWQAANARREEDICAKCGLRKDAETTGGER